MGLTKRVDGQKEWMVSQMKTTVVTCDICGEECGRWYEIDVSIGSEYIQQNVRDMFEIDGVSLCGIGYIPPKCLCKDCMTVLVKAEKRMRKHSKSKG